MPRGDKSSYSSKQKRKAEHIEEGYEKRGVKKTEAERRAWATVNKESGGGNKSGSGRGKKDTHVASKRGGRIVTVGLPNPAESLSINALSLVADAKTLIGSYLGSSIPARDIPRYIALWRAGRLPVEKLLSATGRLDQINEFMDALSSGETIRQVVVPG